MIKKLNLGFRIKQRDYIFYDAKKDAEILAKGLKKACDKIDELVDVVNELEASLKYTRDNLHIR